MGRRYATLGVGRCGRRELRPFGEMSGHIWPEMKVRCEKVGKGGDVGNVLKVESRVVFYCISI
jgi:hypothetical protein